MKYIDADRLRAEIEFSKSVYSSPKRVVHGVADAFEQDGRAAMCDDILKKLNSLQPKQPDVDLEKEIIRYQREDMDRDTTVGDVARHFYELGRNARKED